MAERPALSSAPELVLQTETGSTVMAPVRDYHVGRDPLSDIVLNDARVSWHHAVLHPEADHWTLHDEGSTNGTYADGRRVQDRFVGPGTVIRFGNPQDGPRAVLAGPLPVRGPERPSAVSMPGLTSTFRKPATERRLPPGTVRIGRADDNDLVVDDLIVSRRHAELRPLPDGGHEIVDVGSHNGTFLNGRRVTRAPLAPGDIVGIGHSAFSLVDGRLQEYVDTGEISLDVQDLTVAVDRGRKVLLDHVSFPVGEKCLLAVVGPSGAGKSTLLGALTGQRPADHGTVLYDGRDLYRDYAELRQRIGLVPQDDILHVQLTVRSALAYAAELRFPEDTERAERRARVDEVMRELGLEERAGQRVHSLSGGQRKRVSVALELLTKPSLLFLDEPTSGLDPGMDRSVMQMLRGLADDGRTVIVVTHSVLSLDLCDRLLVLAPGGKVAYFGPPAAALPFFGFDAWPEAFEAFEADRQRDWAGDYRLAPEYRRYVTDAVVQPRRPREGPVIITPPSPPRSWAAQFSTLVRRYTAVLSVDRVFLVTMIGLPFIMGVLLRAVTRGELTRQTEMNALLILTIGGVLIGTANAVRELVKERVIYRRERAVGLPRSAYLASKLLVLGTITVLQAVVLTLVGLLGVDLHAPGGRGVLLPPLAELVVVESLLAFAAMALGLLVSALVPKEEVTMPLLVLLTIAQVVFCGAVLKLNGVPGMEQVAWLSPSRWSLGAAAGTIELSPNPANPVAGDPLFRHETGAWLRNVAVLLALPAVFAFLVSRLLRRHEPAVMRK
ncbi:MULTISPECIES: FHA domain-containing protein [Streptomyces]|uniref:ABC transporter ATP-binding protein n=2 Tax=Streptomyces TaxID=1883 RepID=A0A2U9NVT1_STRAS|nr:MULTISPECIES: FHA domain-containing protein [Streptomyces]AWT41367.1 ABC transporter ATP-binding protein [Streptomyces actuosus]MBM4826083.1 FHA domain-containing protein [Streptomyces actuosus]GHF54328.1 ABC transporter ATP-binding protein [Streptomyces griseosporeus]